MNQVTLIGTIVGHPQDQTDGRHPKLSFSLKTEEIRFTESNPNTATHIHEVLLFGDGVPSHLHLLRPGVLVAVNGRLHSKPDYPTYVLAEHLDVLSEAKETEILASETRRLDSDSTARVSYDGYTRKV